MRGFVVARGRRYVAAEEEGSRRSSRPREEGDEEQEEGTLRWLYQRKARRKAERHSIT